MINELKKSKVLKVNPYMYPGLDDKEVVNQIKIAGGREGLPITKDMILEICTSVINKFNDTEILPEQVKQKSRKSRYVEIRHCSVYHMRKLLDARWRDIGRYLGGRDHSTAINGYNQWDNQSSLAFNKRIHQINNAICRAFGVPEMHK